MCVWNRESRYTMRIGLSACLSSMAMTTTECWVWILEWKFTYKLKCLLDNLVNSIYLMIIYSTFYLNKCGAHDCKDKKHFILHFQIYLQNIRGEKRSLAFQFLLRYDSFAMESPSYILKKFVSHTDSIFKFLTHQLWMRFRCKHSHLRGKG